MEDTISWIELRTVSTVIHPMHSPLALNIGAEHVAMIVPLASS
jgi:hypothetical protein